MKLIIDIPKGTYEAVKVGTINQVLEYKVWNAIKNGTPLDDVKAEIQALPKTYPFVNHIDTYVKEDDVLQILDNIGKAEKDFPQPEDIEPTVKGFADTMDILDRLCEESEE